MKLVYSRRALADLHEIAAYYTATASPAIADAIGHRLEDVIDRICSMPEALAAISGPRRCGYSLSVSDLLSQPQRRD